MKRADEKPKQGDVVMLNSGGPFLLVDEIRPDGIVCVSWHIDSGELKRDAFPAECLRLIYRNG